MILLKNNHCAGAAYDRINPFISVYPRAENRHLLNLFNRNVIDRSIVHLSSRKYIVNYNGSFSNTVLYGTLGYVEYIYTNCTKFYAAIVNGISNEFDGKQRR